MRWCHLSFGQLRIHSNQIDVVQSEAGCRSCCNGSCVHTWNHLRVRHRKRRLSASSTPGTPNPGSTATTATSALATSTPSTAPAAGA
jgi:hypothetical protein